MTSSRVFSVDGFPVPNFKIAASDDSDNDCLIVVSENVKSVATLDAKIGDQLVKYSEVNKSIEKEPSIIRIDKHPFRLIYAPTGPLDRDYDDVRRIFDAASKGMRKALKAGAKKPRVAINFDFAPFGNVTPLVGLLGALDPFYVPLLTRENLPERSQKAEKMSVAFSSLPVSADVVLGTASKLDAARWVFRDIGGTDPERMTPANITAYVQKLFPAGSPVKLDVISEQSVFEKSYPLFAAVNRGVADIPKHNGRIIFLEYTGEGEVQQSFYLVGKGVVYDTGGHDLKCNGVMMGMHRDKCGAATVAGIFKFLHEAKPPGIHVVGAMTLVRNEIGPKAYVADEVITARSGSRVVVINTDAEGRMAMCDVLCEMKERALKRLGKDPEPPQLFTIATLTGHAHLAYGQGYSAVLENGPARQRDIGRQLQVAGERLVDMFEISSLRREDYDVQRCPNEYGDVLQAAGGGASSRSPRGHQAPGAFLVIASGLEAHGIDSDKPLPFCHLDIAGGVGDWLKTDPPNAAAMNAIIGAFFIPMMDDVAPLVTNRR